MTVGASAQLISSNTMTQRESSNYSRLNLSYQSLDFGGDYSLSGVGLSLIKGISVSSSSPIFVETGLGVTYAFHSEDESGYEVKDKFLSIEVPVNLTYKWAITDEINLAPFVGVYFRGNLLAETKVEWDRDDYKADWFDDYDAKRFSFGWNIGLGLEYSSLYVGVSYGADITELIEDADKPSKFSATLGLKF
ncbi:MAG: outer membrane beta-barrel protein [Prevotella sp.]